MKKGRKKRRRKKDVNMKGIQQRKNVDLYQGEQRSNKRDGGVLAKGQILRKGKVRGEKTCYHMQVEYYRRKKKG